MLLLCVVHGGGDRPFLLAIKPWFPDLRSDFTTVYQRANMIASGKMFVANSLPQRCSRCFDWNPLFHAIDQCRGFAFVNYFPRNLVGISALCRLVALLMLGLMGEFYTRQYASSSWNARR